jgi:XTP/dITP diphosphohydrolase
MELVLATGNRDKIREIKQVLKNLKTRILTFKDFSGFPEVVEDKYTLRGNALTKACTVARFSKKLALADDSGLEVEALQGAPGVFSSRFAGEGASYEDNNRKVLSLLEGVPPRRRKAKFRCVVAISNAYGRRKVVEGICEGRITEEIKGGRGFGYDPIFQPRGYNETFAEMSPGLKNEISHRGMALKKARAILEEWNKKRVIGITGNIGCGKTTAAKMFETLGAKLISADEIGHLLLQEKKVKNRLTRIFGSSILDKDGCIKRKNLREIVFSDKKSLEQLDSLLHPLILKEVKKNIKACDDGIILLEAALLLEAGWEYLVDKILVVTSSPQTQLRRIKRGTDFTPQEIRGVIGTQLPQEEKIRQADFVIRNEGREEKTLNQVKEVWEALEKEDCEAWE